MSAIVLVDGIGAWRRSLLLIWRCVECSGTGSLGDQATFVRCCSHSQQMLSVAIHKGNEKASSPPG